MSKAEELLWHRELQYLRAVGKGTRDRRGKPTQKVSRTSVSYRLYRARKLTRNEQAISREQRPA